MKILITTDWYSPIINGVVTSVLNLENELRRNGHDVRVLTLSRNHKSYINGDVIYISSVNAGLIYPNARLKSPLHNRYVSKIIEWKPDVIHSQCEFSTFFVAKKIARILDIPIVHTYHTVYEDYTHYFSPNKKLGKKAVIHFSKWVARHCGMVIVPTAKVKDMLERYNVTCPVRVIPTGIHCEKFYSTDKASGQFIREKLGISHKSFVAVYVGRLAVEKNVDELVLMHEKLQINGVKLLIVGDGPHGEALRTMVNKRDLSDKIIFTGMVPPERVGEYYKCGDVFVSASTSETQGLTYVEALASGLPVICRKDKCLDDVIENKVNGVQFTDFEGYKKAMEKLACSTVLLESMSKNAVDSSRKFSCEAFGKRVENVYKEVLNR